ncbi:MAG: chromosomal replication initiator protein DnaA [Acidobacteria bacterium]|nr:chromosomal replication initiator protein DnaA [Acidobacteriota bacterium]
MNLWDQVLRQLQAEIPGAEYDAWLRDTELLAQKGEKLEVRVPTDRTAVEISNRFGPRIREILNEIASARTIATFVADAVSQPAFPSERPPLQPAAQDLDFVPSVFNPRYRFETFVQGPSNQLAYAASLSIAENPSGSFNPLFIYGGAGLGKTHLIQAIGHMIRERRPSLKVVYMSADSFVNELISSIRYDKMSQFRDRYRSIDALLLDDIQFIAGKERTQEEFFHTFNALYEAQKQIVFTSDAPPRDIPTLEERLRSRFEWGLTADIQPPDLETKIAILRKKAEEKKISLPNEVAMFIAERVRSNIRELEGHLNRVSAYSSLSGHTINLDLTKEALRDLLAKENKPISAQEILRVVASHYGIKVAEMKSKSNSRPIAYPRQIAMYMCKLLTDLSYPEIGKIFNNKHHSTVIYSVEKIEKLREDDPSVGNTLDNLTKHFR